MNDSMIMALLIHKIYNYIMSIKAYHKGLQ